MDIINELNYVPPKQFTIRADPEFDVSRMQLSKVAVGATDLSRVVMNYRLESNISDYKNVAVFEYKDANDELHLKILASSDGGQHSERRVAAWLRENDIQPAQVTRIYSELEPCTVKNSYCKQYLAENTPQAKIYFSFEYGNDRSSSRERGVIELRHYSSSLKKARRQQSNGV